MSVRSKRGPSALRGFSLIELMVAVGIAGILLAIAVPGYNAYIRRSHRTDARSALLDLAGRQERYYNTNGNTYTINLTNLGYNAGGASTLTVGNGYYSVTVAPPNGGTILTGYKITAVPVTPDQLKDTNCLYFYLDNTGQQKAGANAGAAVTGSPCWLQ
jgi:type IV pilus assembly protein PilE